ncbi:MAG: hypothetical protein RLZZ244_753 [Verrucomicrobiota bacterium]|jgi:HSP20 family protein
MNLLEKWSPFQTGKTTLAKTELFRELEEIERRLESLFQRSPFGREPRELLTTGEWYPSVEISEDDKEYLVKADLPEIPKSEIRVSVREGILEISGERRAERAEKGKRYHRVERSYGSFLRAFSLPPGVEGEKAKATFEGGVLTVRIPKNPEAASRSIEIKVS